MPHATFDVIASTKPDLELPLRLEQRSSRTSALLRLGLLLPAVGGLAIPLGLIAANASEAALVVQERPIAAVQLVMALAAWSALFVWPVARLVRRFGSRRTVTVDRQSVTVFERGMFLRRTETRALAEFTGICHLTRTSLSGLRHELMLVDAQAHRHVVFHADDRISTETVCRATALLGLPEIAAKTLTRLPRA